MATEIVINPKRATDYETVFILRPDIDAETSEKVLSRAIASIEATHGRLTKVESWGKRKLAYPIAKQRKGIYVYLRFLGHNGTVAELERNLRMLDTVIRHMTVLIAKNIDSGAVTVDPEEVKVRRIEVTAEEDDREDSFEAQLGLSDDPPPRRIDYDAPPPPPAVDPTTVAEPVAATPDKPIGDA